MVIVAFLAILFLTESLYLWGHSHYNFGVFLVNALTLLLWGLLLFRRPLMTFAQTPLGHAAVLVLGFGLAVFFSLLIFVAVSGYSNRPKGDEKAVVVLGAALHGSQVSRILQYRLDAAYEYYLKNPSAVFVTTGGQGRGEDLPEGRAMREYLMAKGIPAAQVFAEEKSTSTEENFLFAKTILQQQGIDTQTPIVFATNAFHCYRAACYARMAGFEQVRTLPAGISAGAILPSYFREVFALLYYWAFKSSRSGLMHGLVGYLDTWKRF